MRLTKARVIDILKTDGFVLLDKGELKFVVKRVNSDNIDMSPAFKKTAFGHAFV